MTSKEALSKLDAIICDYQCKLKNNGDLYCEDNNEDELLDTIEKDLEILEIIKKYCYIQKEDSFVGNWEQINCWLTNDYKYFKDFEKVKEWLENETRINKSIN